MYWVDTCAFLPAEPFIIPLMYVAVMVDVKSLIAQADALFSRGDWRHASEAYGKALEELVGTSLSNMELKDKARMLRRKAHAESRMQDLMAAKEHLDLSMEICERLGDQNGLADTYKGMGYLFILMEVKDTARHYLSKGLEMATECDDKELMGKILVDLGNTEFFDHEFGKAREEYLRAIQLLEGTGNRNELARAYNNLGESYKRTKDAKASIAQYNKCISLTEASGDETMKALAMTNAAEGLTGIGENEAAKRYIIKVFEIFERTQDKIGLLTAYNVTATIAIAEHDIDSARYLLDKAITLCNEVGTHIHKGEVLRTIAKMYIAEGKAKEAVEAMKMSVDAFENKGHVKDAEESRRMMKKMD